MSINYYYCYYDYPQTLQVLYYPQALAQFIPSAWIAPHPPYSLICICQLTAEMYFPGRTFLTLDQWLSNFSASKNQCVCVCVCVSTAYYKADSQSDKVPW